MADRMTAEERAKEVAVTLWARALLKHRNATDETERHVARAIRSAEEAAREEEREAIAGYVEKVGFRDGRSIARRIRQRGEAP